jgi:hypothetical protein
MTGRLLLLTVATLQTGVAACLVSGTAVDSTTAKPIAGAKIFARPNGVPQKPGILRVTDSTGRFCFERLEAAVYELVAERAGYVPQAYGARRGALEGIKLNVDGVSEMPALPLKMVRAASIAGNITNSAGELLENVRVTLWHKTWDTDEHRWNRDEVWREETDDRGGYRFGRLAPGIYYVSAEEHEEPASLDEKGQPAPGSGSPSYFGGTLRFDRATAIPLEPGQEANVAFAMLPRGGGRSLTVRLAPGMERTDLSTLVVSDRYGDHRANVRIGKDGTAAIHDLMPGKYEVETVNLTPRVEMMVDLTEGDVDGLVLAPERKLDVKVTLINGPAKPVQPPFFARELETGDGAGTTLNSSDGTYLLRGLHPGTYWLEWNGSGYLKNVVIDGRPRPDTILDLAGGAPAQVEAVYSPNLAQLSGHVERGESAQAMAAHVVWMDEEYSHAEALGHSERVDQSGHFQLERLRPCKYRLFAIEGFDEDLWGSPELAAALREKSVVVDLQENDQKYVTLPVITVEEWEKALRKVGM